MAQTHFFIQNDLLTMIFKTIWALGILFNLNQAKCLKS